MKPLHYLLFLPLLGVLLFLTESRLLISSREAEFAKQKLISWESRLTSAKLELADKARSGWALKFMTGSGATASDIDELKSFNAMLDGAAILGKNREQITGTLENIPLATLAQDLEDAASKRIIKRKLTANGWFFLTPVFDFNDALSGFLLSRIKIPSPDGKSLTGIFSPDTETLVFSPKSGFAQDDFRLITASLTKENLRSGGSFLISLSSGNYTAIYEPWPGDNYFLIHLQNRASAFALPSFYFMISSIMVALLTLPFAFPSLREKLTQEKRLAQEVREKHTQTLQTLQAAHTLQKTAYLRELEIPEKLISEREYEVFSKAESPIEGKSPATEQIKEQPETEIRHFEASAPILRTAEETGKAEIIELIPMKREFVFLDPLADKSIPGKNDNIEKTLSPEEQKIRKRALSPELINLMRDIGGENEGHPVFRKIMQFLTTYSKPEIPETIFFLNELYFDDVSKSEIDIALNPAMKMANCDRVALVAYDGELGCYRMQYGHNVPENLEKHLYFLKNDEVFLLPTQKISITHIKPEIKENPYFAKRFPEIFLQKVQSILSVPLSDSHFNAFLLFFCEEQATLSTSESAPLKKYLNQIAPALKFYCATQAQQKTEVNLTGELIKEIRTITNSSRESAVILHIHYPTPQNNSFSSSIFVQIGQKLSTGDRFIHCSPIHSILLLKNDISEPLQKIIDEYLPGTKFQKYIFPELGKNYYCYI